MREEMRHADPEKVAKWKQGGLVLQESTIGGSPDDMRRNGFQWPITEELLDACLNNIRVLRDLFYS
jgi:hypothetical protein